MHWNNRRTQSADTNTRNIQTQWQLEGTVHVCVWVRTLLPCQLAQSHHFFVGNIPDVNLERDNSQ